MTIGRDIHRDEFSKGGHRRHRMGELPRNANLDLHVSTVDMRIHGDEEVGMLIDDNLLEAVRNVVAIVVSQHLNLRPRDVDVEAAWYVDGSWRGCSRADQYTEEFCGYATRIKSKLPPANGRTVANLVCERGHHTTVEFDMVNKPLI